VRHLGISLVIVLAAASAHAGLSLSSCTSWIRNHWRPGETRESAAYLAADFDAPHHLARALASLANQVSEEVRAGAGPAAAFTLVESLETAWTHYHPARPFSFRGHRKLERAYALPPMRTVRRARPRGTYPLSDRQRATIALRLAEDGYRYSRSTATVLAEAKKFCRSAHLYRPTYYTSAAGKTLPAGLLVLSFPDKDQSDRTLMLLAPPRDIPALFLQMQIHLQTARDLPPTQRYLPYRLRQFALALYVYYQASPYDQASHLAGTALFRGMFHALFDRRLQTHFSESTVMEMLSLSQTGFVEEMLPFLWASVNQ